MFKGEWRSLEFPIVFMNNKTELEFISAAVASPLKTQITLKKDNTLIVSYRSQEQEERVYRLFALLAGRVKVPKFPYQLSMHIDMRNYKPETALRLATRIGKETKYTIDIRSYDKYKTLEVQCLAHVFSATEVISHMRKCEEAMANEYVI